MSSWNAEPARHSKIIEQHYLHVELNVVLECRASSTFENKHTTLFANAELNVELECRANLTFKKNCTTLYPNVELNVELECRASSTFENKHTTLYVNAELNVELECRASSTFKNKHTTLYANAELNVELECRASSTFGNLNVELMSNVERRANFTHLRYTFWSTSARPTRNEIMCCVVTSATMKSKRSMALRYWPAFSSLSSCRQSSALTTTGNDCLKVVSSSALLHQGVSHRYCYACFLSFEYELVEHL
ncbi:hypothetical protein DPMN_044734 [Dreissena polymorpha]|uniref:Uncharacterized protein n=1 Tax=Dreissena polymorpha TaxID=45954 RepID=A0A9D4D4Y0_DREPO|nr:hypothetical protein DPMN_044734 [Dreissena polymorpha]